MNSLRLPRLEALRDVAHHRNRRPPYLVAQPKILGELSFPCDAVNAFIEFTGLLPGIDLFKSLPGRHGPTPFTFPPPMYSGFQRETLNAKLETLRSRRDHLRGLLHQLANHLVDGDAFALRGEVEDEPVPQNRRRHRDDVVTRHVVRTAEQRVRLRREDQVHAGTRAGRPRSATSARTPRLPVCPGATGA